jgi:hypothetical protein
VYCAWRVACTRRGINPPSLRDEFARRERGERPETIEISVPPKVGERTEDGALVI